MRTVFTASKTPASEDMAEKMVLVVSSITTRRSRSGEKSLINFSRTSLFNEEVDTASFRLWLPCNERIVAPSFSEAVSFV